MDNLVEEERMINLRSRGLGNRQEEGSEFVNQIMKDRLMRVMQTRNFLEKLVGEQKNEELTLKEYIQQFQNNPSLFEFGKHHDEASSFQNPNTIALLQKRISEIEEKHGQEFDKRVKLQKAFLNFKTEGNSIIDRLRFALRQVGAKYRKERLKNRHLVKRLNEQLLNSNDINESEKMRKLKQLLQATNNELQKYKVQFGRVEDKFVTYKKMVVDHKKVIIALRKKVERITETNEHLRKQITGVQGEINQQNEDTLRNIASPAHNIRAQPTQAELSPFVQTKEGSSDEEDESGSSSEEEEEGEEELDSDIQYRLKKYGVDVGSSENNPKKLAGDQKQLIKSLLDKLEKEEDHRLKIEEQSSAIVENEERTISFLESQIQNLTSGSVMKGDDKDSDDLEGYSPIRDTVE